jgi:predicted MPP superfamily phosphohydrolase
MSVLGTILAIFATSQIYWAWKAFAWARSRIRNPRTRLIACAAAVLAYVLLFTFNFGRFAPDRTAVHLTLADALLAAPFLWWVASSLVGFLLVVILTTATLPVRLARRLARPQPDLASPPRREFLQRTTTVFASAPFVAGAYGLFYGRLNLETTVRPIHLARLPKAFAGFRIVQLSDIHIGPFMTEDEIRKYVAIANSLRADLAVLTGDYVTFDPDTQEAVVKSLSGLKAPFGVFGCLGNHDAWTRVEDSITELFRAAGIRILRQESVPISTHGESLNLIGTDFQTRRRFGPSAANPRVLSAIEGLIQPGQVNLLLSHNPDTFDRAAQLGIDLSLAGHTHGGQAALEFISPELAPSRLVTPYVAGWFQKPGGQLYVNRGIGTIGVPIRIGAPPEITVFELVG